MVFANALESIGYKKPNTPAGNITNINLEQKKKPYDVKINNNARQPKVTPNVKYSDKHRFRQYRTKIEPNLFKKIEVNEEDDIMDKIKSALNPEYKKPNTNYSEEITAPAPFNNGVDQPPLTETKMYNGLTKHNSDMISVITLQKEFEKYMTPEEQKERDRLIDKYDLDNVEKHKQPEIGKRILQDLLEKRREKWGEINDVSKEDFEELTFQPAEADLERERKDQEFLSSLKAIDLSSIKPKGDDDSMSFYDDDDVSVRPLNEKELSAKINASNMLKYNLQKKLQKKANKVIRDDYEVAKFEQSLNESRDMTLSPLMKGNKVMGLSTYMGATPERKKRYSLGLDVALPTPHKLGITQRKGYRDAAVSPRGPGRPPDSALRSVNPSRFSLGEMTNPLQF